VQKFVKDFDRRLDDCRQVQPTPKGDLPTETPAQTAAREHCEDNEHEYGKVPIVTATPPSPDTIKALGVTP
jgi:hypothetical protein